VARIFTKKSHQEKRRSLRKNMTKAEIILWVQLKNKKYFRIPVFKTI
jgi:very-short-patch-repair endonuclease